MYEERQFFMVKLLKITCFDLALIKMSRALPKKLLLLDFSREEGGGQDKKSSSLFT